MREPDGREGRWARAPLATALLLGCFLLPNLVVLGNGFVWDDLLQLVDSDRVHSLRNIGALWTEAYWAGEGGHALYRPLTKTLWALLWAAGGGRAWVFRLAGLALGAGVVLLLRRALRVEGYPARTAFLAAALFALLPVHTEATATAVGMAELLAALLCLAALLAYRAGRPLAALPLLVGAVLSKESAVAFPFAALLAFSGRRWREHLPAAGVGAVVAAAAVVANRLVTGGPSPLFIHNPLALEPAGWRILSALWVQVLYLARTVVPLGLSAEYGFDQVPPVTSLADPRGWAALALAAALAFLVLRVRASRPPVLLYAILFLPTANLLFPIGTIMGERLAYLPSAGIALGGALLLARRRHWPAALAAVALVFGAATVARNLTWADSERFTATLVRTAPGSANAWFQRGAVLAGSGEDERALGAYDRALAILPGYADALFNRANALVRLGRLDEAAASYRASLAADPGRRAAAEALDYLARGVSFRPIPRRY